MPRGAGLKRQGQVRENVASIQKLRRATADGQRGNGDITPRVARQWNCLTTGMNTIVGSSLESLPERLVWPSPCFFGFVKP